MTKYAVLCENNNNELMYIGSFIGKNHYKIKFVVYRYLKNILETKTPITFAIHSLRINKWYVYIGTTETLQPIEIRTEKIKSINRVYRASGEDSRKFLAKLKGGSIPYTKTHSYRENYNYDDVSVSESDSEFDSNE